MAQPPYGYGDDWLDRFVLADVYKRRDDPYQPFSAELAPTGTAAGGVLAPPSTDIYAGAITPPGVRPVVYQRALNLTVPVVDTAPTPIQAGTFQCDAILIAVPSSSSNSTFFGYSSGISSATGIECRPGIPQFFSPDNTREQWELQRLLEAITALLGFMAGAMVQEPPFPGPGQFLAPRVVLDAHNYYLINATGVTQNVPVMLFNVPDFQ